jgi:predicted  nucleic acid-binding Zn-ribbon protein
MNSIQSLIKYQEFDFELVRLNSTLAASDAYKNYSKYKKLVGDATEAVKKLNVSAEEVKNGYAESHAALETLMKEAKEIASVVDEVNSSPEVGFYFKKLEGLYAEIARHEAKIRDVIGKIKDLSAKYKKTMNEGKANSGEFKKCSEEYTAYKKEHTDGDFNNLQAQMRELQVKIDPKYMEMYAGLRRGQKKLPYIVQYRDNCCGGCGMDLDVSLRGKLNEEGVIGCPNCNRILYKD